MHDIASNPVADPKPVLDKPLMHYGRRTLERLAPGAEQTDYRLVEVSPLTPHFGAVLGGVDLTRPITDELAEELRQALLEWKVIFFRGQTGFNSEHHMALSGLWGPPEPNPFFGRTDTVGISRLAKDAKAAGNKNIWHSDHSFMANPSLGAVLRAVEVPAAGGDTMWADMGAAYDNLPDDLKERIEDLVAVHDWEMSWGALMNDEQKAAFRASWPRVEHPVVVRHPRSGRRTLYVNEPFTSHIKGLSAEENRELLDILVLQARIPEFQIRFHWEPDSIAIWDNIAVQHYAVNDYFPQRRVMERIAIAGVPLS
ncbi:TauD/TfdA family dioxygenase [Streptomyces sp. VRA16 Mangrove soil]|uniref:TauD/TfdA dioxygenase family protein n=1 Tax=Streptomyces sp. VRA16 Mangrove soil TaxID=2817434 RepID=UPI001A9EA798|nr:TauD/TfdA family dioxygenase [Streptomyces sp. VRA16 Mangrove soil]MBO1333621.1 TauD/TfdA family dioxygenase [Streptomyces sp. VRA16 Mangrove soil]